MLQLCEIWPIRQIFELVCQSVVVEQMWKYWYLWHIPPPSIYHLTQCVSPVNNFNGTIVVSPVFANNSSNSARTMPHNSVRISRNSQTGSAVTGQAGIKIFKYWPLLIFYTTRGDNISISTTVVQYQYIKLWLDSFRNMASVFLILGHIKLASSIGQFNCTLMKNYVSYLVLRERKGLWQCHNVSKGALTETLDSKGCSRQVGHFNQQTTFQAYL